VLLEFGQNIDHIDEKQVVDYRFMATYQVRIPTIYLVPRIKFTSVVAIVRKHGITLEIGDAPSWFTQLKEWYQDIVVGLPEWVKNILPTVSIVAATSITINAITELLSNSAIQYLVGLVTGLLNSLGALT